MKRRHVDTVAIVIKKDPGDDGNGLDEDHPTTTECEIPVSPEKRSAILSTRYPNHIVPFPRETDPAVLLRRTKQIEYGKNTPEYVEYSRVVPKDKREPHHPKTPNVNRKYSRRAWDGLIKHWRVDLHLWNKTEQEITLEHIRRRREQRDDCLSSTNSTSTNCSDEKASVDSCLENIKKEEKSWFEDCEEWEGDYLDLHPKVEKTEDEEEEDEDDGIKITM